MKGLFLKDWYYLRRILPFLLIAYVLLAGMTLAGSQDVGFIITFFMVFSGFYVISTFSWDQMDNNETFLFSLPVSRSEYVWEKYLLSLGLCLGSGFISVLIALAAGMIHQNLDFEEIFVFFGIGLMVCVVFISIFYPLVLKLGSVRARYALIIICLIPMLFAYGSEAPMDWIFNLNLSAAMAAVLCTVIGLVLLAGSMFLSDYFLKQKDF